LLVYCIKALEKPQRGNLGDALEQWRHFSGRQTLERGLLWSPSQAATLAFAPGAPNKIVIFTHHLLVSVPHARDRKICQLLFLTVERIASDCLYTGAICLR
jgi:hypothetical protein